MLASQDKHIIESAYSPECGYPLEALLHALEKTLDDFDQSYLARASEIPLPALPHPHAILSIRNGFVRIYECVAGDGTREFLDGFLMMLPDAAKGLDMEGGAENGQAQKWKLEAQQRAFAVGLDYLRNPTPDVKGNVKAPVNVRGLG